MQTLRLYLEEIDGDWFGWIETFPGAFSVGTTPEAAVQAAPAALMDYLDWLRAHDALPSQRSQDLIRSTWQVEVETHRLPRAASTGEESTVSFGPDEEPLEDEDLEHCLSLLTHSRSDLRKAVRALPPESLYTAPFGGKSVLSLLRRLAETELFSLGCLRLTPQVAEEDDSMKWLEAVRREFVRAVRALPASQRGEVYTVQGERWSLRKVLHRTLGQERHHTAQIALRSNPVAFLQTAVADLRLWDEGVRSRA